MIEEVIEEVTRIVSPVYLVGGAVRDYIMDREIDDFDFTTPLTPEEVEKQIIKNNPGRKIWSPGKRFGTIATKVYLPKADQFIKVEITTFRTETYETGSRKPQVEFTTSLHEDLMRRDFTMNAICIRMKKGRIHIIDPFNGVDDIENEIIRGVGFPKQRFKEDPLRMLRACRFAATLGFDIEESTFKKMQSGAIQILNVSKERWMIELDKLLQSDHVSKGLNILADSRLLTFMIPELAVQVGFNQMTPHHDFELWEHTVKVVEAIPKEDLVLRWAGLLHDIGKPFVARVKDNNPNQKIYVGHEVIGADMVDKLAKHLKWKNDQREEVVKIVAKHLDTKSKLKYYDSGAQKRREDATS